MIDDDAKIGRFKYKLDEELNIYYRNHKRLAIYIIVNSITADLLANRFFQSRVDKYGTIYYQNYKIAIDNGMTYLEFKVLGD